MEAMGRSAVRRKQRKRFPQVKGVINSEVEGDSEKKKKEKELRECKDLCVSGSESAKEKSRGGR